MTFPSRTRVVINMDANIEIERAGKRVNMENKTCSIGDDVQVVCFTFQACLLYTGINVEENKDFSVSYELDPKKLNRRLYFKRWPDRSGMEEIIRLRRGEQACRRHLVYLLVRYKTHKLHIVHEYRVLYTLYSSIEYSAWFIQVRFPD